MPIDFNVDRVTPIKTDHGMKVQSNTVHAAVPAPINPFDIEPVRTELSANEEAVKKMVAKSRAFKITNDESNSMAVQMGLQAKKLAKRIKEAGAEKTKEHRLFTGAVRNLVKVYTDMLEDIETGLKGKFRDYSRIKEMKRREAERIAQVAAEKVQRQINREAKVKNIEPVHVPTPALPQKQAPTRTEEGSASIKKVWTWKLINITEVPDEYKILDAVAVNKAIRGAVRNITGIEIFQEDKPVFRG